MMTVHQCFAMKFRHATGITHTNLNHGPLSDKSDPPPSQFAGYDPDDLKASGVINHNKELNGSYYCLIIRSEKE